MRLWGDFWGAKFSFKGVNFLKLCEFLSKIHANLVNFTKKFTKFTPHKNHAKKFTPFSQKSVNFIPNFAKKFTKFAPNFAQISKTLTLSIALFFAACGYVPNSKIANQVFNDKVYVYAAISTKDPKNSIYIVDTVREVLINRLGKSPTTKDEAQDFLQLNAQSVSFTPIIYDENGYVVGYRTRVVLDFEAILGGEKVPKITTSGNYDFAISPNSIISDSARLEAIQAASSEAFDEFVSVIAIRGLGGEKGKNFNEKLAKSSEKFTKNAKNQVAKGEKFTKNGENQSPKDKNSQSKMMNFSGENQNLAGKRRENDDK